jgi:hypothetical protein
MYTFMNYIYYYLQRYFNFLKGRFFSQYFDHILKLEGNLESKPTTFLHEWHRT